MFILAIYFKWLHRGLAYSFSARIQLYFRDPIVLVLVYALSAFVVFASPRRDSKVCIFNSLHLLTFTSLKPFGKLGKFWKKENGGTNELVMVCISAGTYSPHINSVYAIGFLLVTCLLSVCCKLISSSWASLYQKGVSPINMYILMMILVLFSLHSTIFKIVCVQILYPNSFLTSRNANKNHKVLIPI